jgi:HEAT repeat protein
MKLSERERGDTLFAMYQQSRTQMPNADDLKIVEQALLDSNEHVRSTAAAFISQMLYPLPELQGPKNRDGLLNLLKASPALGQACLLGLRQADLPVRGVCADMLLKIAPPLTAEVKAALVDTYRKEEDRAVRSVIVYGLIQQAPDDAPVQQVLLAALDDSDDRVKRAAASALANAKTKPPSALPRLVAGLQKNGGTERDSEGRLHATFDFRDDFIRAMASYGSAAKPYVSVLENLRVNEPTKARAIQQAIDRIQNGTP